jgi:hypothetical protein
MVCTFPDIEIHVCDSVSLSIKSECICFLLLPYLRVLVYFLPIAEKDSAYWKAVKLAIIWNSSKGEQFFRLAGHVASKYELYRSYVLIGIKSLMTKSCLSFLNNVNETYNINVNEENRNSREENVFKHLILFDCKFSTYLK